MSPPSSVASGVTVHLPAALGLPATEHRALSVSGATVREVIDALEAAHPGMRFALCLETGELRPFVNIYVNGAHIRYLRGLDSPTPAGASLHIFQSVAGG